MGDYLSRVSTSLAFPEVNRVIELLNEIWNRGDDARDDIVKIVHILCVKVEITKNVE